MENFKLSIPTPCHERWEDFTPTPTGGFCSSCQKNVIDFTRMDDSELVAFFGDNQGKNLCGSFRNEQLEHNYTINQWFPEWAIEANMARIEMPIQAIQSKSKILRLPKGLRYAAAFAMLIFSFESNGQSQTIKGRVLDADDKSPIPGVYISIKGNQKGIQSNSNGEYEIVVDKNDKLVFSFVGYESKEIQADKANQVDLKMDTQVLGELVVVGFVNEAEPTEGLLDPLIEKMIQKRALKKENSITRGKVIDEENNPLAGVSVQIKEAKKGTTTNEKGEFEIKAKPNEKLTFSFVGLKNQELEATKAKEVKMQADEVALDDVTVIGYGGFKGKVSCGAVSCVTQTAWSYISYENNPLEKQKIKTGIAIAANPTVGDETLIIPKLEEEIADNQAFINEWISKNAFQQVHQVWVYDLRGKQYPIRYEKVNDGVIKLNLSRVPDGIYILRMSYSNERSPTKEVISMARLEVAR